MKKHLLLLLPFLFYAQLFAQSFKREVRAIWLTTHLSLDWPAMADDIATKKSKLIAMLDSHKALGINTVYFQVRGVGDAFYASALVPWSNRLTGATGYGVDPGWDPLAFVVEECHKRGMEIHAWLNPYRAATDVAVIPSYSATHKAKTNPEWLLASGIIRYFNPGLEAVRNHIVDVVKEIVANYDIDGIHFDDYFYQGTPADTQTFTDYPRGFTTIADWRRDNITLLISNVNTAIKVLKPWVKFGASPSGIYRSKSAQYPDGSETSTTATQHYASHFADSKYWLDQGYVDYLVPQVYWYIGQSGSDYSKLIPWWAAQANNRHVYIGIAAYKVNDAAQGAFKTNPNEIADQINLLRANTNLKGAAYFRSAFVISDPLNFRTNLLNNQYAKPALLPVMSWIDNVGPAEPQNLVSSLSGSGKTTLTWSAPPPTAIELDKVYKYAIYRSAGQTIDYENDLIAVTNKASEISFTDNDVTPGSGISYYYAVKAVDRLNNESAASNIVPDAVTLPITLAKFEAKKNGNKAELIWVTLNETNNAKYEIERSINQKDFRTIQVIPVAEANSTIEKNYFAVDYLPYQGINYYRLVQYDKDGIRTELGDKALRFDELSQILVKVYPNPTAAQINFSFSNFKQGQIKSKLFDLFGKVIHQETFNGDDAADFTLSLKHKLPTGNYVLSLESAAGIKNLKVIVL